MVFSLEIMLALAVKICYENIDTPVIYKKYVRLELYGHRSKDLFLYPSPKKKNIRTNRNKDQSSYKAHI